MFGYELYIPDHVLSCSLYSLLGYEKALSLDPNNQSYKDNLDAVKEKIALFPDAGTGLYTIVAAKITVRKYSLSL